MPNYCGIFNAKKLSNEEVLSSLRSALKIKLGIDVETSFTPEYLEIKYKSFVFPFFKESKRFDFYDVSSNGFDRHNERNHPYRYVVGPLISYGNAYGYIYEYLKHYLANMEGCKLDSDGIGPISPEITAEKFSSLSAWLKYCYKEDETDKFIKKQITKKLYKKTVVADKKFFPELF
jgi:hypothetical protein